MERRREMEEKRVSGCFPSAVRRWMIRGEEEEEEEEEEDNWTYKTPPI